MSQAVEVLSAPRDGHVCSESNDVAVHRAGRGWFRAVVADGATVGFDAGRWARLVADELADLPGSRWGADGYRAAVASAQQRWISHPPAFLSFFHEEAWRRGAATTVAALTVARTVRGLELRTLSVGDSLVVVVRDGRLIALPGTAAPTFGLYPDLVTTAGCPPSPRVGRHRLRRGDRVLVMTDALAAWALADERSWERLATIPPSRFLGWVNALRCAGVVADDDVLLVRA